MLSEKSFQQFPNLSNALESLNLSLYTKLRLHGYLANSIISLCKQNTTGSLCLASILFTDYCETSLQIRKLRKRQLQLESHLGQLVHTCWKNQVEPTECGVNYPRLDTDGSTTNDNCPVVNFAQLELDLYPGMP